MPNSNLMETNMAEQKPFGDVPSKVASSVQRSMTATRAMVKALKSAFEIIEEIKLVRNDAFVYDSID